MGVDKKVLGMRLAAARSAKGLSQRKLGALIGISGPAIAGIETGPYWPSVDTLVDLADALDVSLDWLCGRTDHSDWPPSS